MITLNLKPKQITVLYDVLNWAKHDIGKKGIDEMDDEDWKYFHIIDKLQEEIVCLENSK